MSKSIGKFLGAPAVNNQDDGYPQSLVQTLQQYLAQNNIPSLENNIIDSDAVDDIKEFSLGFRYNF